MTKRGAPHVGERLFGELSVVRAGWSGGCLLPLPPASRPKRATADKQDDGQNDDE
jgi:hypothetical protein